MSERSVVFGNSAVAIVARGERAEAIVEFLFREIPAAPGPAPHVAYTLQEDEARRLVLLREGQRVGQTASDAGAAELLMSETCRELATESRGGLLFHAAAVGSPAGATLIPGHIGAGKTTLTAWLTAAQGAACLTDEMVFIPEGSAEIQTFRRPLNLKPGGRAVLAEWIDFPALGDDLLADGLACLVAPRALGSVAASGAVPLTRILFPTFTAGGDLEVQTLTKAQAGMALMQRLVNARNLPDHGLSETARLARLAPARALRYGSFAQLGAGVLRDLTS